MPGILKSIFIKPVKNMHLRGKLLLAFFLLIIIPFGFFTVFFSGRVSESMVNLVKYSANQSFEQSEAFISYKIEKILNAMDVILLNNDNINLLASNPEALGMYGQSKKGNDFSQYLSSFQDKDEIFRVGIYVNDGFEYFKDSVNIFGLKDAESDGNIKRMLENRGKVFWYSSLLPQDDPAGSSDGKRLITAIRAFTDPNDYSRLIAILKFDIFESRIKEILKKASPTKSSVTYLLNSRNEIISSSIDTIKSEWRFDRAAAEEYMDTGVYSASHNPGSGRILATMVEVPDTDWVMVSIVPYNEILEVSKKIRYEIFLLSLAIGALAYFISFLISTSVSKRIRLLAGKMKRIKNGEFETRIDSDSSDEIGELISDFNDMAARISFLIKEQFRLGQQAKNSELMALQAQINPHFLYNTMDLISWTAINNDVPEISAIVRSLSKFYKLSLSKGANIIPIRDELEHVKLYVEIQNRRFNNKIAFQTEIDEAVYDYSTLKTILQPVVENSIMHGILEKKERCGGILLTARLNNGFIRFTVKDDGVGIPAEKMEGILSRLERNPGSGYGIKNINERIKLYYGEQYGMSFESEVGLGTVVTISIPAVGNINTQIFC